MLKLKAVILCLMLSGALYSLQQALGKVNALRNNPLPEKIYSQYKAQEQQAEYYLKNSGGYVTVYADSNFDRALRVTDIECSSLRRADRAMLEKGIPVRDRVQLLGLLEDLSS